MSKTRHLEEGEIIEDNKDERRKNGKDHEPPEKRTKIDKESNISTRTGGAYIPPARLRMMQQQITDKSSEQYQRISWEALKKSINGLINKVNTSNISSIVRELFQENIVRGRGVLAQSILQAQNASPTFTKVYAALVAIINTRFPQNGELILRRLALQFRRSYKRNRKELCLHSAQFIAHLMNQQVAHEIIGLQILTLLLENPTDDSVEVAIGFLKECGQKLLEVSPRGLAAVMERLRTILHEQELDKRVQYMIEVMFAIRKDGFKEHPSVEEDLDLVEETDQFTHMLQLDDDGGGKGTENELNVFHMDPEFIQNEENYKQIKKDILDESSEGSDSSDSGSSSDDSSDEEPEEEKTQEIEDRTETNLVALRRTIYLAIQSSLDFEECAHKLLKMEFDVKDYKEICAMIIDCCSQLRTYEKFFGLLGARFCILKKEFMEHFEILFGEQYETIHRLETNKLRNVAKFFAHLLHSDALPWTVLQNISLSEDTTTSSSRIFIKILFQELVEYLGLPKLNQRLKDETLAPFFEGLFPKDSPKNTRFAINFFTSIGLGGITDELREHLKTTALKMSEKMQAEQIAQLNMDSSNESSSESSEEEKKKRKKSKKKKKASKKSKKKKKKETSESSDSESEESDHVSNKTMKSTISRPLPTHRVEEDEDKLDRRDEQKRESRKSRNKRREESTSDEETQKRNSLRERLLKISNTVPEKHTEEVLEKRLNQGKDKKKKHRSSSDSSSENSSSETSDTSSEEEAKKRNKKLQRKQRDSKKKPVMRDVPYKSSESSDDGKKGNVRYFNTSNLERNEDRRKHGDRQVQISDEYTGSHNERNSKVRRSLRDSESSNEDKKSHNVSNSKARRSRQDSESCDENKKSRNVSNSKVRRSREDSESSDESKKFRNVSNSKARRSRKDSKSSDENAEPRNEKYSKVRSSRKDSESSDENAEPRNKKNLKVRRSRKDSESSDENADPRNKKNSKVRRSRKDSESSDENADPFNEKNSKVRRSRKDSESSDENADPRNEKNSKVRRSRKDSESSDREKISSEEYSRKDGRRSRKHGDERRTISSDSSKSEEEKRNTNHESSFGRKKRGFVSSEEKENRHDRQNTKGRGGDKLIERRKNRNAKSRMQRSGSSSSDSSREQPKEVRAYERRRQNEGEENRYKGRDKKRNDSTSSGEVMDHRIQKVKERKTERRKREYADNRRSR